MTTIFEAVTEETEYKYECECCGEGTNKKSTLTTVYRESCARKESEQVCEACLETDYGFCEKTEEYWHNDDLYTVNVRVRRDDGTTGAYGAYRMAERKVSWEWKENNAFECDDCGEYYESEHYRYNGNDFEVCQICYDQDYFTCSGCDEVQNMDNYNDEGYCNDCDGGSSSSGIHEYSFKPVPKFRGKQLKKNPYIGFELEVEVKGNRSDMAKKVPQEWLYCKNDGSLNDGFEIVSHPATLGVHKKEEYKALFETLSRGGARSHDTKTCGLHFHVCRDGMSEGHKVRLGMLMAFCKPEFEKLARRTESTYAKYKRVDKNVLQYHTYDRYSALNWQNEHTVEFRIFKGTLKYETFMASMELCHAAFVFTYDKDCFSVPENEAETLKLIYVQETFSKKIWRKFSRFIYKNKDHYENLVTYIRSKNLNPDDNKEEI